ncbi:MAG TPA: ROK family transcriptional regulator, partial [bacterium]|nr:ROK family transcriptional regulator [bacterium]
MERALAEKRNLASNSFHPHRRKNYWIILETIKNYNAPISIAELSRITKISYPTIASVLDELYEKKLIQFKKDSMVPVGRKPVTVEFCSDAGALIGMEIGNETYGIVVNFKGDIIYSTSSSLRKHDLNEKHLIEFINALSGTGLAGRKLYGIGVGISGMVNSEGEYINIETGNRLSVRRIIEENFCVPVIVENDANMMMLAESQFGVARGIQNVIYILKTSSGIGFGIMIHGELYRGARGLAGENLEIVPEKIVSNGNGNTKPATQFIKAIAKLLYLFDPDMIILGGEFLNLGQPFLYYLRNELEKTDEVKRSIRI